MFAQPSTIGCFPCLTTSSCIGRAADLEEALVELARDLGLARRMGGAAARLARDRFDSATMALAYSRLYEELA